MALASKKSDQLNADDLIVGHKTIKITDVEIDPNAEQRFIVHYEGEDGRPWKPALTVARQLARLLGDSESKWIGHHVELYRDESVKWAGEEVGGIRINAIDTVTKVTQFNQRMGRSGYKKVIIHPLVIPKPEKNQKVTPKEYVEAQKKNIAKMSKEDVDSYISSNKAAIEKLYENNPDLHQDILQALSDRRLSLGEDNLKEVENNFIKSL